MQIARTPLVRHPHTPWAGPEVLIDGACVVGVGGTLDCRFTVDGDVTGLVVPAAAGRGRVDGLWRHTCFEVFIARRGATGYREFNFSPSGAWAAYEFSAYRVAAGTPELAVPVVTVAVASDRLVLAARLGTGACPTPGSGVLEIALAAVIEATDGALGYFSGRHPAERPDFHDRRGFIPASESGDDTTGPESGPSGAPARNPARSGSR